MISLVELITRAVIQLSIVNQDSFLLLICYFLYSNYYNL